MARSARKTTSPTTTKTTPASTTEQTPVEPPVAAEETKGAESPATGGENAPEALPEAPEGDPDEITTPEEEVVPVEEVEAEPKPSKASEKTASLNDADVAFKTDENGNALSPVVPKRATSHVAYYPFEYEDGEDKDTIVATERVCSVMKFYGTERLGRAFAYPKGTVLSRAILDAVDPDA